MMQSLSGRLLITASVVLIVFLGITGIILDRAFVISQKKGVRERLKLHTYAILAVTDEVNGRIFAPKFLQESRFNKRKSELLAIITDESGKEIWRSISAFKRNIDYGRRAKQGQWVYGYSTVENRTKKIQGNAPIQQYFVSNYGVRWSTDRSRQVYNITVMERSDVYAEELNEYRVRLISTLGVLVLILLLLQRIILHWGLSPLRHLAKDLAMIDKGQREELTGAYPKEIKPMAVNLNLLIANERRQREKYRSTLADLSHSLKTPLAVLQGLESDAKYAKPPLTIEQLLERVKKQVLRMSSIVSYQLQRASPSGKAVSISATSIAEEVAAIIEALNKVYNLKKTEHKKPIEVTHKITPELLFYGDENDLIEILGNLLDNAYKFCDHQVIVEIAPLTVDMNQTGIEIHIEDDGPGVPEEQREPILKRGVRLDTMREGQGLGLAMVVDIIASYNGTISIDRSELGGAHFKVVLPENGSATK